MRHTLAPIALFLCLTLSGLLCAGRCFGQIQHFRRFPVYYQVNEFSSGPAMAASGAIVVVGAPDNNNTNGAVFVYTLDNGALTQQAMLTPGDATAGTSGFQFGYSVAVSGTTIAVGAPGAANGRGAVYLFHGNGSTWTQQAKLTDNPAISADFGEALALNGNTLAVGASREYTSTGQVYIYTFANNVWTHSQTLLNHDGVKGDSMGAALAISGDRLLIGSPGKTTRVARGAGAAYVWTNVAGKWKETAQLTADDAMDNDSLGGTVAISGDYVVLGASAHNTYVGEAYVFSIQSGRWQRTLLLRPEDDVTTFFGSRVAINSTTIAVSAGFNNRTYIYDLTGTGYTIAPFDPLAGYNLQGNLALTDDTILTLTYGYIFTFH